MRYQFFIFLSLFLIFSCKNSKKGIGSSNTLFDLSDSNATANALLKEDSEGFFEKLQAIDVAIQLKDNEYLNDKNYVENYRVYLKSQASDFNASEKEFMVDITKEAIELVNAVNSKIIPKFQICKIKTGHYGNDVYYTRGNAIFIPENIFVAPKKEEQMPIMLHEIWHIISEQNPKLKEDLYKLIGFEKHNKKLKYPLALKKLLLTNPDGAHDEYAIKLTGNKLALPIIMSSKSKWDASNPIFFNHLKFELFGIDENGNVEAGADLTSMLTPDQQSSFFANIKDNTQYIIHADEIIADNFMLALLANKSGDYTKFNPGGKKLIENVLKVLRESKP
jgi:hypothetical protein